MSSSADGRPPATSRRGGSPRRLDALDGLRTIAVFLVIAYHVSVPSASGGFLGVDVFFVLSGYLITTLLLTQIVGRGSLDLGRFWARRVLRLLPASFVVVVAVVVWAIVAAPPYRRPSIGADALFSLVYVANWHFVSTASYFSSDGTQSPLQHMWSLAVEEQFYFAWPLLLFALCAVLLTRSGGGPAGSVTDSFARNERNDARRSVMGRAAATLAVTIAVVSALRLWTGYDPAAPDRAYMGTDTKAFEPLLGAVAAALMLRTGVRRWVTRHASILMAAGLLGIGVGVATLGGSHAPDPSYFYGGAAGFAAVCSVLVAATSVADRRRGFCLVLGSTPMAYLGRISYGLYLWHWPLAVWVIGDHAGFSPRRAALVVLATVALAAASYHFLEVPLRSGALTRVRPQRLLPASFAVLAAGAVVAATLGGTPLNRVVPAVAAGDAGGTSVLVVGDSVMRRLVPTLAPTAAARGVTILNAARGGCPAMGIDALDGAGVPLSGGKCATEVPAAQSELLARSRPGVVVWWSRYELADRIGPDGTKLRAGTRAFWSAQRADLDKAVARLTATGAKLVIVQTDRVGRGIDSRCRPNACDPFLARLRNDDAVRVQWNRLVDEVAARDARVETIRMDDLFCRDDVNPCDDSLPVRDGVRGETRAVSRTGYARPDGSHFGDAAREPVSVGLLERVSAAVGGSFGAP